MNIFIGNLSWTMTDADLMNVFTPFGEVSAAKIVTDKLNNNRSKGFGFVEMPNDEEAKNAIANLYDTEIRGRKIIVNESQPREQNRGGGAGGYRKRGGYDSGS
jgi:RNA recognition motif-containing protein